MVIPVNIFGPLLLVIAPAQGDHLYFVEPDNYFCDGINTELWQVQQLMLLLQLLMVLQAAVTTHH
jgi:hypothetical protein